jgi:uncharacterized protein YukE
VGEGMKIDVEMANFQARRIKESSSRLTELKSSLNAIKGNLHDGWKATEMTYIDNAFGQLNKKLAEISADLHSIGSDIISAAYEIKLEEDLREEAERKKNSL